MGGGVSLESVSTGVVLELASIWASLVLEFTGPGPCPWVYWSVGLQVQAWRKELQGLVWHWTCLLPVSNQEAKSVSASLETKISGAGLVLRMVCSLELLGLPWL